MVRIDDTDPGSVTATPARHAVCNYEAGITECRMTSTGKVTLGFRNGTRPRSLQVVVIA